MRALNDTLHEDAGGVDHVRVERADGDNFFDLGHRHLASGCHHRIEVASRRAVDEIALRVALPGFDDGKIGHKPRLHDIGFAVEVFVLFALGDDRADAGLCVEARNACPACAAPLGQCALRVELKL